MKKVTDCFCFTKLLCSVLITFILLMLNTGFAKPVPNFSNKTLLTIKLYSEPHGRDKRLTYILTLPQGEYYSLYKGSDLPDWRFVNDSVIQGEFHSVSLVSIRVHPRPQQALDHSRKTQNTASLIIIDPENARVIWQGEINYARKGNINIKTDINNQKYYDTQIKVVAATETVWFETTDK